MTAALTLVAPLIGAAAKKSSSGSSILIIYAAIAAAFYFLFYRPRQRKAKAAREATNAFDVGDEVLTAGGIVGHVIDIDGDRVTLETSVGASFVVLKQYVIRRLEPPVDEEEDDSEFEDDHHDELGAGDGHHDQSSASEDSAEHGADNTEHAEEPPAAEERPTGTRGATKRGKKPNNSDDQNGLDGPPII
jgi:preprotein translocase subunit YajC